MSDAEQRAAEVIRYEIGSEYETLSRSLAKALAAAGLLVDDDTARLVNLGRAVEAMSRCIQSTNSAGGWNACLDAIYEEAGREATA